MSLRITTWNICRGSFCDHVDKMIERYDPEIMAFQEIPRPSDKDLACYFDYQFVWAGINEKQGVAVGVKKPLSITALPIDESLPDLTRPYIISGENLSLFVLSVWTKPEPTYAESLRKSLVGYSDYLHKHPSIVLGDFNCSVSLDPKGGKRTKFSDVARMMEEDFKLKSAWHSTKQEDHGQESAATLYFLHAQKNPFHIDFIYLPQSFQVTSIEIGTFEDWKGLSDHRPMVADIISKGNLKNEPSH
jgi:exonuclease III